MNIGDEVVVIGIFEEDGTYVAPDSAGELANFINRRGTVAQVRKSWLKQPYVPHIRVYFTSINKTETFAYNELKKIQQQAEWEI